MKHVNSKFYWRFTISLNFILVNLQPSYFDNLRSDSVIFSGIGSQSACQAYCSINENCIFYAFTLDDDIFEELSRGSCIFKSKVDISNGTNVPEQIKIFSLLSKYSRLKFYLLDF